MIHLKRWSVKTETDYCLQTQSDQTKTCTRVEAQKLRPYIAIFWKITPFKTELPASWTGLREVTHTTHAITHCEHIHTTYNEYRLIVKGHVKPCEDR